MSEEIYFEQIRSGGCLSYLVADKKARVCLVIDPEIDKADEYLSIAGSLSCALTCAIDSHTHADHASACKILREKHGARVAMHRAAEAPYVDVRLDDGETLRCGGISIKVLHTPGHTQDSTCLVLEDKIFTGDTLLIGGCGRTDLPGGDPEQQYESLRRLAALEDQLRVFPAHDYRMAVSTLGEEKTSNPRLLIPTRNEFVQFMSARKPPLPRKFHSALEWNRSPIQGTQRGMGEGI
jgi:glyoxylase-like metal-dependent hydrolase (beta-lactamase superfamily II)